MDPILKSRLLQPAVKVLVQAPLQRAGNDFSGALLQTQINSFYKTNCGMRNGFPLCAWCVITSVCVRGCVCVFPYWPLKACDAR